jgi:site-specific recombinase XerD
MMMLKTVEWIDEFLLHLKQAGYSEYTMKQYDWHLRRLVGYLAERGLETPDRVDRRTLRRWGAELADRWAPATRRQAVFATRGFFQFLVEEEVLTRNPSLALIPPNDPPRQQRTLLGKVEK